MFSVNFLISCNAFVSSWWFFRFPSLKRLHPQLAWVACKALTLQGRFGSNLTVLGQTLSWQLGIFGVRYSPPWSWCPAEWGSEIVFSARLGHWGKDRPPQIQTHKTIQWFTLEKTFKIVKSSSAKSTTKPCPSASQLHIFSAPSGMITPPLPWAAPCDS